MLGRVKWCPGLNHNKWQKELWGLKVIWKDLREGDQKGSSIFCEDCDGTVGEQQRSAMAPTCPQQDGVSIARTCLRDLFFQDMSEVSMALQECLQLSADGQRDIRV